MQTAIIFLLFVCLVAFLALGVAIWQLSTREEKLKKITDKATADLESEKAKIKGMITELKARVIVLKAEIEAIEKLLK